MKKIILEVETKTNLSFPFEGKVYLFRDSSEQLPEWMRKTNTELKPYAKRGDITAEILLHFFSTRGVLLEKGGKEHIYANFLMIKEPTNYAGWCVVNHPLIAVASDLSLKEIDKMVEPSIKLISIEYPGNGLEKFYRRCIDLGFGDFQVMCFGGELPAQKDCEMLEKTIKGGTLKELEDLPEFKESVKNSQIADRYLLAIKKEGFEAIRYSECMHKVETDSGNNIFVPVGAYICDVKVWNKNKVWQLIENTIIYPITTKRLSEVHSKLEEITATKE